MSVNHFVYNIVNLETEIKTAIEIEIKMICKLKTETKTKKIFKIEIQ